MIRALLPDERDRGLEKAFLELCATDCIYGSKVYNLYELFGKHYDAARFWVYYDETDSPMAALAVFGGGLTIASPTINWPEKQKSGLSFSELGEFLPFASCNRVYSSYLISKNIHKLKGGVLTSGCCMICRQMPDQAMLSIEPTQTFSEVYRLLCEAFHLEYNSESYGWWLLQNSANYRKGNCEIYAIYCAGEMAATAGIYSQDDRYGHIGGVAVAEQYTGKGFGRALAAFATRQVIKKGKTATLCCKPDMEAFYEKLGYRTIGGWGELVLPSTK